jgi:hypothetical protein
MEGLHEAEWGECFFIHLTGQNSQSSTEIPGKTKCGEGSRTC